MPSSASRTLADRKKHVYDEDIEALVDEKIATAHDRIKLVVAVRRLPAPAGPQRATMKLDVDGKIVTEEQEGNGPVDATFNAIKALVPHEARAGALSGACGDRGHRCAGGGLRAPRRRRRSVTVPRRRPDTLVASAQAYLGALNKLMSHGARLHAQHAAE